MNSKIEKLRKLGCDVDAAIKRMLDDEDFYIECLEDIPEDKYFTELEYALKEHDIPTAFDAAHTLKGILANVGLTPMLDKINEIVESLRAGNDDNLLKKYYELAEIKERIFEILK